MLKKSIAATLRTYIFSRLFFELLRSDGGSGVLEADVDAFVDPFRDAVEGDSLVVPFEVGLGQGCPDWPQIARPD